VLECLSQDYVRTARAKGVPERVILAKHVLRNAMMPVITAWALDVANLFGGAVITESIFGWPGMGRLIVESVTYRDFPTVASAVFFITLVFVALNLTGGSQLRVAGPAREARMSPRPIAGRGAP
jgi:peptide/nickel transport system permease protein